MGARRERECSRGTGGGDTGIGSTGEWLRSRASSNGRGGRWPSCRVAVTPRCRHAEWSAESGGRAVSAVFPNTPARSTEWEQRGVRVVAGSDLRRKRPREGPIRPSRARNRGREADSEARVGQARVTGLHCTTPGRVGQNLRESRSRPRGAGRDVGRATRARERNAGRDAGTNVDRVRSPGRGRAPVHRRRRGRR
jgi:hypothetical protein